MSGRDSITVRIDAALEKMRAQSMEVRSINLTREDWDSFNAERSAEFGCKVIAFSWRDHEIRESQRSIVWSKQGVSVCVPKRLSHRVAA